MWQTNNVKSKLATLFVKFHACSINSLDRQRGRTFRYATEEVLTGTVPRLPYSADRASNLS